MGITSNRRILVIGSQCASLPPPFSFLPQAAVDLHAVMTDPEVGGCTGLTHHNSESGLAGKPCLLVKFKLLDHLVATFR